MRARPRTPLTYTPLQGYGTPLLYSPGGSLLPSTPGPSLIVRQRSEVGSKQAAGRTYTTNEWAIAITPRRRPMDRGILAQQSDVRCKRGRLCVIMIAPAAHTSKGLAKSFVSSAGGKGPETFRGALRPLFLAYRGARLPSSGLQ